jgi:hypothetical protein
MNLKVVKKDMGRAPAPAPLNLDLSVVPQLTHAQAVEAASRLTPLIA